MIHAFAVLAVLLHQSSAAPDSPHPMLDFSSEPADSVQLIGDASHRMVPESGGESGWVFEGGVLTAPLAWDSVVTPAAYGDFRMHLEFNVNAATNEEREKNGNSGVYIQQRYEIQILDSFGIAAGDYQAWDCGSLYRLKRPDRLASRPAGAWQSYDILFRAARYDGERKTENARITTFHNEQLIHEDVSLERKTGSGQAEGAAPRPIKLQGHHNQVRFRNAWIQPLTLDAIPPVPRSDPRRAQKKLPLPGEVFFVGGCTAFTIEPPERPAGRMPWVWYAPTLPRLPAQEEAWMFERLLAAGIAIAGIDAGESYGSPAGTRSFEALYEHLTTERAYAPRPALLARSRGGLMLYGWASQHPDSVAAIAGIYPVCNLESYPGIAKAAPAYGLSPQELSAQLKTYNPIDRLAPLAEAQVPVLHIHGDRDTVVPLESNSGVLARRYAALGAPVQVSIQEGRGHDMWTGWFQSQPITDFLIEHALAGAAR